MIEPKTYLGASSRHAYCTDYSFHTGVPLKMFGREEKCEKITWLDVKNCTGSMYLDTFKDLPNLEILNFTKCNFDNISSAFKNLEHLRSIDIWSSKIPLNKATLEGSNRLNSLRVINCPEIEIAEDAFIELKNLENLMVQKNNFSVGDHTFSMLENMKHLFLQGCEVEFNTKFPFKGSRNLNFLGFNNCKLKNVSINTFLELDKLETLSMNNNDFGDQTFDFQSFQTLPKLETISFPMMVLEKVDFSQFKKLKTVQFELDEKNAGALMNRLKEQNINYEWCSSGEIPEIDERDPNIQICA